MPKNPLHFEDRPDFVGLGAFRAEHGSLERLECCLFLPMSEVAKIWILVRASSPGDSLTVVSWRFSCELRADGDVLIAEEIFHSGYTQWDWGNGAENTLVGEITKLTVNCGDVHSSKVSGARFAITPSALLRSADIVSEQNGELVRQVARKGPVCCVSPGLVFRFSSAYRRGTAGNLQSTVECELVEPAQMRDPKRALSSLDDVLAVASFAERRVLKLTGWNFSYSNGATTTYYRRDFTVPSEEETDIDTTLIALRDIEEFLNRSVRSLRSCRSPGALKQAIYFALHGQDRGIGGPFIILFVGIETLLNLFGPLRDVGRIIPNEQWQTLTDRISSLLKGQETFLSLPDDIQGKLQKNILGANRASFGDRFKQMCSSQNIDLADLWPMVGAKASLSAMRSRIVHGRVFASDQEWFRVISAKYHLLWTLERSILCSLGWPVEKSRVSAKSLSGMTLYDSWRADLEYFTSGS